MRKVHIIYIIISLVLLAGCQNKQNANSSDIPYIPIRDGLKDVHPEPYFFKQAKMVPLETTNDCLMGAVMQVEALDSLLFIKDTFERLYVFNRNGKFVTRVGTEGNGPGEYLLLSSFFVDAANKRVAILDDVKGNILYYDFQGIFLNNKRVPIEYIRRVRQSIQVNEEEILLLNSFNFEENMGYTLLNIPKHDSVTFKKFKPYAPISLKEHTYVFSQHAMTRYKNQIHAIMPICDTVFTYHKGELIPRFVLETPQKMANRNDFSEITPANPYFFVEIEVGKRGYFTGFSTLFETDQLLLLNFKDHGGVLGFYIADKTDLWGDYYLYSYRFDKGQIPVFPIVGVTKNQLIGTLECENLLNFKDQIDTSRPEYACLKEIMDGNHADYNPVLVFYQN